MKKILLILTLLIIAIVIGRIVFNAEKIYTTSYTLTEEENLTTVPNYSKEKGFDIVSQEEYEKYQQGYCLSENRILSFEEKYRRAIGQYLDKRLEFDKLYYAEWCWTHTDQNCRFNTEDDIRKGIDVTPEAIAYYELNDNFTFSNWFEVLEEVCKEECGLNRNRYKYRNFFFNELNTTKTDPKQYLIINKDDMTAGFSRPIIVYRGYYDGTFYLFLDKSFILLNNSSIFFYNHISIYRNTSISEYQKINYERDLKERNYEGKAIDNCGNIDFNVKKEFEESKSGMNQGG
jgi:hypothetical protein